MTSFGKNVKISLDHFRIHEAQILGYVFKDWLMCNTLFFWSESMTPMHYAKYNKYHQPDQATQDKLASTNLSQNVQENLRIFRQLKGCLPHKKNL